MKKLLIIAVLALLLTALVGTAAIGSGGPNSAGATVKDTIVYQMYPGDYIDDYNNLYGLLQDRYYDLFVIVNIGPGTGTWEMEIEDCCILGDTMLAIKLGEGGREIGRATSPATILLGPVTMPQYSWVLVITGYIDCPGGFPAGYYWYIWM